MEKKLKKIWVRKTLNGKVMRRGFNFLANKLKWFINILMRYMKENGLSFTR